MVERRKKPRIYDALPVRVTGVDDMGRKFERDVQLDNLSASGLFLRMTPRVRIGDRLLLEVRIPATSGDIDSACVRVAANGVVKRIEDHVDGTIGIAVEFMSHRFV